MDISIVKKAGLSDSQAKCYVALIQNGAQTPTDLAKFTGENRTNTYAVLNRLVELNLATKNEDEKKLIFSAAHPSNLEVLAEKRRRVMTRNEQEIKENIRTLIDQFYLRSETPSVRTLEGVDGFRTINNDILIEKKDVFVIRNKSEYMDDTLREDMKGFRAQKASLGINTYALTPKTERSLRHLEEGYDEKWLYHRTFLPEGSYTTPVKIAVYGNKTTFSINGKSPLATIINSPMIADAMREIIMLLSKELKNEDINKIN